MAGRMIWQDQGKKLNHFARDAKWLPTLQATTEKKMSTCSLLGFAHAVRVYAGFFCAVLMALFIAFFEYLNLSCKFLMKTNTIKAILDIHIEFIFNSKLAPPNF